MAGSRMPSLAQEARQRVLPDSGSRRSEIVPGLRAGVLDRVLQRYDRTDAATIALGLAGLGYGAHKLRKLVKTSADVLTVPPSGLPRRPQVARDLEKLRLSFWSGIRQREHPINIRENNMRELLEKRKREGFVVTSPLQAGLQITR